MDNLTSRLEMLFLGVPSIDEKMKLFKTEVIMDEEERAEKEEDILSDLEPLLIDTFGRCQVHIFGSMQSGLSLKGGDIDVYVEIGGSSRSASYSATTLGQALRSNRKFDDIEAVPKAKVPIVCMVHVPTQTKCDVSFNTPLNIEHGHLLKFYVNLHPRFVDVLLVIKTWAKKNRICDGRLYIGSFAWNLLFVNYLQTLTRSDGTKIVPSLLEMQANSTSHRMVQGCRVDFNPAIRQVDLPEESEFSHLGLLNGFFRYYKEFSFKDNIVCPYLGIPVSRNGTSSEFSPEIAKHMTNLRTYVKQGATYRHFRFIQDPFNHKHFIVCRSENFSRVTSYIAKSAKLVGERFMDMQPDSQSGFLEELLY